MKMAVKKIFDMDLHASRKLVRLKVCDFEPIWQRVAVSIFMACVQFGT
jgi:hypothetical protein